MGSASAALRRSAEDFNTISGATPASSSASAALRRSAEDFNGLVPRGMLKAIISAALRRSAEDFNKLLGWASKTYGDECSAASQR